MFSKPLIPIILGSLLFSVVSFVGGYIYWAIESRDREISNLREELLNKHMELTKQNYELQKQANEFHAFNSKRYEYEKSLVNKYSIPSLSDNPCEEGILDSLIRKSFDGN